MSRKRIVVLFGFDMESDIGSWTTAYDGLKYGTPKILRILKKYNVKATFFFTGKAAEASPDTVKSVKKDGHEIGCHTLYHETVGDEIFPIPFMNPIMKSEVRERLRAATETVKRISGVRPVSFRSPRLFCSTEVINALEKLGYIADASYPLYYLKKQLLPYHPSSKDWTRKGNLKILEIPNFADMTLKSKDKFGRDRDQWPKFRTKGAGILLKSIDRVTKLMHRKSNEAVLCFYMHPWEFIKMPSKLKTAEADINLNEFLSKNTGDYACRQLDELISALLDRGSNIVNIKEYAIRPHKTIGVKI